MHFRNAFLFVAALLACDGSTTTGPSVEPVASEIRAAPLTATLAGQQINLDAQLARDFMPVLGSDDGTGRPLVALVQVAVQGGAPVAPTAVVDSVWVVYGDQAWVTRPTVQHASSAASSLLTLIAREGPKWGPLVRVDVIARVSDGAGHAVYVRVADRLIARTD